MNAKKLKQANECDAAYLRGMEDARRSERRTLLTELRLFVEQTHGLSLKVQKANIIAEIDRLLGSGV